MSADQTLIAYTLRLADNALILAQRMIELVAAEPELEEELANANFALDYIGQARMLYSHAGELEGNGLQGMLGLTPYRYPAGPARCRG